MIRRPASEAVLSDVKADLWAAFVDAYLSSGTREAVDVFLRGLVGAPAKER